MQILDVTNSIKDHGYYKEPIINIYGVGGDIIHYYNFYPYFYAQVHPNAENTFYNTLNLMNIKYEIEKKFLPLGYQTEKIEVVKIIAEDPRDIRRLRSEVKDLPGCIEIFEADILFKNRFLIDKGLSGMGYCDEKCVAYQKEGNEDLKILSFDIEVLPPATLEMPVAENGDKVIVISFAFSHLFENEKTLVLILGNKGTKTYDKDVIFFPDERSLLWYFNLVFNMYNPDVITGYNINGFDFEYIYKRQNANHLISNIGRGNTRLWVKKGFQNTTVSVTGRVIFDLLPLVKANYNYPSYNLKTIAHELLKNEKIDLPMRQMREEYVNGEYDNTIKYARRDAVLALELLYNTKFVDKYIAISKLTGILLQDCVNSGQTQKIEILLTQRYRKKDRLMAMKPDFDSSDDEDDDVKYSGADVLSPEIRLIKDVVVLDYKSLYPTIMISQNYSYDTLILDKEKYKDVPSHQAVVGGLFVDQSVLIGVVPEILSELLNERIRIKKLMKKAEGSEKEYLDARQYALKILLNSFYGYSGYARARLFAVDIAQAVTSFGRQNIKETKAYIEGLPGLYYRDGIVYHVEEAKAKFKYLDHQEPYTFKVVYGDTDSVFIEVKNKNIKYGSISLNVLKELGIKIGSERSKQLPAPMELLYEKIAKTIIFEAKKKYAYWHFEQNKSGIWENKIKAAGIETKRRDWVKIVGSTLQKCLEEILINDNVNAAVEHVSESVKKIENLEYKNVNDLSQILTSKKYTKHVEKYKVVPIHIKVAKKMIKRNEQINLGDRISYVIVEGDGEYSDRAESAEEVVKHNLEIDRKYYIEKQLLPPMDRFFKVLKIDRSKYYKGLNSNKKDRIIMKTNGKNEMQKSLFSYER